jgi:hypothetical protein
MSEDCLADESIDSDPEGLARVARGVWRIRQRLERCRKTCRWSAETRVLERTYAALVRTYAKLTEATTKLRRSAGNRT